VWERNTSIRCIRACHLRARRSAGVSRRQRSQARPGTARCRCRRKIDGRHTQSDRRARSYVAESDFFEPQWRRSFWAFACVLHPKFLDDLIERHRGECYENILSFSTLVGLIRDALVLRSWGSERQSNISPTSDGWQTRRTQNPVPAWGCGFKSRLRYSQHARRSASSAWFVALRLT
jgi:hypothetical protein